MFMIWVVLQDLLSLNAKAKDGGRATLSVEMSLKHTTYINCSKTHLEERHWCQFSVTQVIVAEVL